MKQSSFLDGQPAFGGRVVFSVTNPSREAKQSIEKISDVLRGQCVEALTKGDYTADEVADMLKLSVLSIRPRFTELLKAGRIEDTGIRRKNVSGRNATVWRLV